METLGRGFLFIKILPKTTPEDRPEVCDGGGGEEQKILLFLELPSLMNVNFQPIIRGLKNDIFDWDQV